MSLKSNVQKCKSVHSITPSSRNFWLSALLLSATLAFTTTYAFPEISVDLNLEWEPEVGSLLQHLQPKQVRKSPPSGSTTSLHKTTNILPFLPFASAIELELSLELQQDSPDQTVSVEEVANGQTKSGGDTQAVKMEAQHDAPFMFVGPGGRFNQQPYGGYAGLGGSMPYGQGTYGQDAGAVNFDFNCKCSAKSNLAKSLLPVPTDVNAAAQQQVQQLQEQVRRLQEQINRAQAGKSSFEQFAQMLAQADGLDCSCTGASAPFSNLSGANSNNRGNSGFGSNGMIPYGQGMTGNPFGPAYGGSGRFFPQNIYGAQNPYGGAAVFTPMNKS